MKDKTENNLQGGETKMTITFSNVVAFELPTPRPSTIEYRYDARNHNVEVWCFVYYLVDGKRTIADGTLVKQLQWLPMNEAGIDYKEEAWRDFMDNYAARRWSSQSAPDTALGFVPSEQWL